jgi:glycosyltransferase involved in cell wall biosynthesis
VAKKMGKAGKNYVLENYAWKHITDRYLSIFSAIKQKAQQASINIMTACLSGGDAIGNYIQSQRKIFTELGYCVNIFADGGDTDFIPSSKYESTGKDILWFHYSIYSNNLKHIKGSRDFKIMDFHGVSPPKQFRGYNKTLEELTRKGVKYLNRYVKDFNLCVVHSDYTFNELKRVGYKNIIKSPLVINKEIFEASQDPIFSRLLSQLDYLLFVGRIVPQKDIISIIRLFSELKGIRQKIVLFLVGDTDISMKYTKEVYGLIESLGLEKNILLTGKIVDPHILTTFFKYAKFLIILSEWESFCVPIIEAMHFRVPVIGIEKTCIPETIGDAGILLKDLDFKRNAEIINSFWPDEEKYESLQQNCIKRSKLFEEEELKIRMKEIVENVFPEDMY